MPDIQDLIKRTRKTMAIGEIPSWDFMFSEAHHEIRRMNVPSQPVREGTTEFPLLPQFTSREPAPLNQCMMVTPTSEFMSIIEASIGHLRADKPLYPVPGYDDLLVLGAFKLIEWEKDGVALVIAARADHFDFGSWMGFIDMAKVPVIALAEEPARRVKRTI